MIKGYRGSICDSLVQDYTVIFHNIFYVYKLFCLYKPYSLWLLAFNDFPEAARHA